MQRRDAELAVCLVLAASLFARTAQGYSDPLSFDDSTTAGGGAGRWFTGSPAEGFGCDVCHEGGQPADLEVSGLPADGYRPGASYEVRVRWPAELPHVALVAEFTSGTLANAGVLSLPPPESYGPDDLCSEEQGAFPATGLLQANDGRTLVSTIDCGARTTRLIWTAPAVDQGEVWFAAGFVNADDDDTPRGDAATLVRLPMPLEGQPQTAAPQVEGCRAGAKPAAAADGTLLVGLWLGMMLALRASVAKRTDV